MIDSASLSTVPCGSGANLEDSWIFNLSPPIALLEIFLDQRIPWYLGVFKAPPRGKPSVTTWFLRRELWEVLLGSKGLSESESARNSSKSEHGRVRGLDDIKMVPSSEASDVERWVPVGPSTSAEEFSGRPALWASIRKCFWKKTDLLCLGRPKRAVQQKGSRSRIWPWSYGRKVGKPCWPGFRSLKRGGSFMESVAKQLRC